MSPVQVSSSTSPLLILFTAGNLLPQQVIITPLYRIYLAIPLPHFLSGSGLLYNSILGLIVINVAFQVGSASSCSATT